LLTLALLHFHEPFYDAKNALLSESSLMTQKSH
jgi:hypothetical protein